MIRFKFYLNKDEETKWLNEMSGEGYAMKSFFAGFYGFEPCEKGEWQYQVDIGQGFYTVSPQYRSFMEDLGVEIVQCWGPWVILRRKAEDGEFQLYTDVDSRIAQYKKILLLFKIVTAIMILGLLYNVYAAFSGLTLGWAGICLFVAFLIAFFNVIVSTKDVLTKLYEQKGEPSPFKRSGAVSPAVPAGFFVCYLNLLGADHLPTFLRLILLIASVTLLLYGSVRTAKNRRS